MSIMRTLNTVYDLEETRSFRRRVAIAMVVGFMVTVSALVAFSVLLLGAVNPKGIASGLGFDEPFGVVIGFVRWPLAFTVLCISAGAIYRFAPVGKGSLRAIGSGALVFAALWTLASGLLVAYVSNADTLTATYGTLTGLVVTLLWLYATSLAFIAGALVDAQVRGSGTFH
jgi:membrane protein